MSSTQKGPIVPSPIAPIFFLLSFVMLSVYFFSKQRRFLIHFTDVEMRLFEGPVVEIPDVTGPPQQGLPRT